MAKGKWRLSLWKAKLRELDLKSQQNEGLLRRQEWWERQYYETPYLTFASNEYLEQRFFDHFHNQLRLTADGKLGFRRDWSDDQGLLAPLFTHMMLEFSSRGLDLPKANEKGFRQIAKERLINAFGCAEMVT